MDLRLVWEDTEFRINATVINNVRSSTETWMINAKY